MRAPPNFLHTPTLRLSLQQTQPLKTSSRKIYIIMWIPIQLSRKWSIAGVHKGKGTCHVTRYNENFKTLKITTGICVLSPVHSLGEMKNLTSVFSVLRTEKKQTLSEDSTP
jgi:hypothetical protein